AAEHRRAIERYEAIGTRLATTKTELDDARRLVEALTARARAAGLEELERRIAELRAAERRARDDERGALGAQARASNELSSLADAARESERRVDELRGDMDARSVELRAKLQGSLATADIHALETYV